MKRLTVLLTAAMLSISSLDACSQSEDRKMSIQEQTEQRFRPNPNPKEAYRIRIKINDAPGPLKLMSDISVGYMAENCSYLITSKIIGATAHPRKSLKTPIYKVGEDEYETVIYRDAMLDEDYFGEGICRWKPDGFGAGFKATGLPEETEFNFGDFVDNLIEKKIITKYYWKARYPFPINPQTDFVDFGSESLDAFSAENQKNLFTITLTIEDIK